MTGLERAARTCLEGPQMSGPQWWKPEKLQGCELTHTEEPETGKMLPDIKPQNSSQVTSDGETKAEHAQAHLISKAGPGYEL